MIFFRNLHKTDFLSGQILSTLCKHGKDRTGPRILRFLDFTPHLISRHCFSNPQQPFYTKQEGKNRP